MSFPGVVKTTGVSDSNFEFWCLRFEFLYSMVPSPSELISPLF